VNALFARIRLTRPYCVWVGVADPKGTVVHATGNQLVGRNISDNTWFTAGASGPYVSDVVPAKLLAPLRPQRLGRAAAAGGFLGPIRVDGQLIGVLGMHTSWDWAREMVQELLPTFSREDQISLFIFDRQGKLIFAPGGKLSPFIAVDQTPPAPGTAAGGPPPPRVQASVVRWNDQSDDFLTAVAQLPARNAPSDLGWYVVARQPVASAYADAQQQMLYVMGAGLLAAITATWLVWWLARRMVRELNTLAQTARRIDAGERQVPIPELQSNREVQLLSQSFNAMTQRLLAANESMEHEVQMRTQELYDANRELDRQASTDP
jgi:HAMP domain-containing protein